MNALEPGAMIRICCGPRCGTAPDHRRIYRAIERLTSMARPTLCQGHCGGGVTVVLPDGAVVKVASADEATAALGG